MEHPVNDVTPTMLTPNVISTLRQADHLANQVLNANQESKNNLSQMPLVLIPIHFDRYVKSESKKGPTLKNWPLLKDLQFLSNLHDTW